MDASTFKNSYMEYYTVNYAGKPELLKTTSELETPCKTPRDAEYAVAKSEQNDESIGYVVFQHGVIPLQISNKNDITFVKTEKNNTIALDSNDMIVIADKDKWVAVWGNAAIA